MIILAQVPPPDPSEVQVGAVEAVTSIGVTQSLASERETDPNVAILSNWVKIALFELDVQDAERS